MPDETRSEETRSEAHASWAFHCCVDVVLPAFLFVTGIFILVVFVWIGPDALLRWMLTLLPEDPTWVDAVWLGLAIVVCLVLLLPLWPPLMIVSAMVFGFWGGYLVNFCSMVVGSMISFVLGRTLCMRSFRNLLEERDYRSMRRMVRVIEDEENSVKFMLLFRFLMLPIWVRSYVPSLTNISVWIFLFAVVVHALWICAIFAMTGAATKDAAEVYTHGGSMWDADPSQILVFCVATVSFLLISWLAYREYSNKMVDDDEEEEPLVA